MSSSINFNSAQINQVSEQPQQHQQQGQGLLGQAVNAIKNCNKGLVGLGLLMLAGQASSAVLSRQEKPLFKGTIVSPKNQNVTLKFKNDCKIESNIVTGKYIDKDQQVFVEGTSDSPNGCALKKISFGNGTVVEHIQGDLARFGADNTCEVLELNVGKDECFNKKYLSANKPDRPRIAKPVKEILIEFEDKEYTFCKTAFDNVNPNDKEYTLSPNKEHVISLGIVNCKTKAIELKPDNETYKCMALPDNINSFATDECYEAEITCPAGMEQPPFKSNMKCTSKEQFLNRYKTNAPTTPPPTTPTPSGNSDTINGILAIVGAVTITAAGTFAYLKIKDVCGQKQIDLAPRDELFSQYVARLEKIGREVAKEHIKRYGYSEKSIHDLWDSMQYINNKLGYLDIIPIKGSSLEQEEFLADIEFGPFFTEGVTEVLVDKLGTDVVEEYEGSYVPKTDLERVMQENPDGSLLKDFMEGSIVTVSEALQSTLAYVFPRRFC